MMEKWVLCLVARIDKGAQGTEVRFDDVWLGEELHDWLLIVPLADARLVSEKLERRCLAIVQRRLWHRPILCQLIVILSIALPHENPCNPAVQKHKISVSMCGRKLFPCCLHTLVKSRPSSCAVKTEFRIE